VSASEAHRRPVTNKLGATSLGALLAYTLLANFLALRPIDRPVRPAIVSPPRETVSAPPPPTAASGAAATLAVATRPWTQPTSTVLLSPAERIHRALEHEVQRCMQTRGFAYEPRDFAVADSAADDPEFAATHGYGLVDAYEESRDRKLIRQKQSPAERAAYEHALDGADPDETDRLDADVIVFELPNGDRALWDRSSCRAQAERNVFTDDLTYQRAVLAQEQHRQHITRLTNADPDYLTGLTRFAECMHAQGYPYGKPREASYDLYEAHEHGTLSLETLHDQEIATANADLACQHTTGLPDLQRAATARAEAKLASELPPEAAALSTMEQAALQRADNLTL
jgi:hypothetical protein